MASPSIYSFYELSRSARHKRIMHRSAHTACRAVSASRPAASPGIWITDDVLADALHRFARTSPSTTSRRHGSTVPGPLEHRRRSNHRRMNAAAVGLGDSLPPLPTLPQWAQPSDTFDRLKQMIDPNGRFWRTDNFHYQPPNPSTSQRTTYSTAPLAESRLQSPIVPAAIPFGLSEGPSKSQSADTVKLAANLSDLELDQGNAQTDDNNVTFEQLLLQPDPKPLEMLRLLKHDTLHTVSGNNLLLACRYLADACVDVSRFGSLLQCLASAHASSQLTGWQFVIALHHLGQFQPHQLQSLNTSIDLARSVWHDTASQVIEPTKQNGISLDAFLSMNVDSRVHLISAPDAISSPPDYLPNCIHDFLPLGIFKLVSDSKSDILQLTKTLVAELQDLSQLLERLPQPLVQNWATCSVQAFCAELQSQSEDGRHDSFKMLSTWLKSLHARLPIEHSQACWKSIYSHLAKTCKPADIHSYFQALEANTSARVIWRYWVCDKPGIAANFVDAVDSKLVKTPDTMIRSEQYRHLAPYVHLAWQTRQHLHNSQYALVLVLDLLRESGAWKDFGHFCSLIRKRYQMSIPLWSTIKFLQQVPQSEAKAAAKVYLADRRVHYSDVHGLLDKMRQSKELHPALFKNFVRRPSAKRNCWPGSGDKLGQTKQRHYDDMLNATSAVCRTERFSIRTRVGLAAAFIRDARKFGVKAPRQLTRKLVDVAFAGSMRRGDKIPIDVVRAVLHEVAEAHGQEAADALDKLIYRYWGWLIRGWRRERHAAAKAEREQAAIDAGIVREEASSSQGTS